MRIWPFGREKAMTQTAAVLDAVQNQDWSPFPLLGGGSRQRIMDAYNVAQGANYAWMYARSPAVRTVIDVIVRNVGQLDLRLYEEIDESDREPRPEHPAALSLRYPNEDTTADAFIRQLFTDYLIYKNAYALLLPASDRQISLIHLPTSSVEIRGSSLFRSEGYRFWRSDGTWLDFTPDEVLHWRGENPLDPRVGLSPLETLRGVIAEDAALQQATVELANSGMTQQFYGYRPPEAKELSRDIRTRFEEDIGNRMRNANRIPFILQEGTELRALGVSPRDAQMLEVRRWAIERIATQYGVPLGMVGLADDVEAAQAAFYADTLPPYCEDFTKMLNQRILVRVYNQKPLCFEFNLDEKHMGDDRISALISATGRPVLTTNEARAKLNLPSIDGGDELVTPLNVTEGSNPKPSTDVMPIQDPNKPPQDGSYREEPKTGRKEIVSSRRADLERQHEYIGVASRAIERHYDRLGRSMKEKSRKAVKASDRDWERWTREFGEDLHDVAARIVGKEGELYALKLAGRFDMALVRNYIEAMAFGAAEQINDSIRDDVEKFGPEQGLAQRAVHVASAGTGFGAGVTRWAREEAARQSPGFQNRVKVWIANTNRHAEFAGDTVPVGADWPAGFAPGSAPGCACSMAIY